MGICPSYMDLDLVSDNISLSVTQFLFVLLSRTDVVQEHIPRNQYLALIGWKSSMTHIFGMPN